MNTQRIDFNAMTKEELMSFWYRYHRATRKDAELLVGDRRPGFTNVAAKLANYACNKAVMMTCSAAGDANGVSVYEHSMRLCLEDLPADVLERVVK